MTRSDQIGGLMLGILGIACITAAGQLPSIPGQPIGPAVFPIVIGAGLCLCAILIFFSIGGTASAPAEEYAYRMPLLLFRLAAPGALLVGYYFLVEPIGFLVCGSILVAGAALMMGARLVFAVPLALAATVFIYSIFSSVLRVPLPHGIVSLPW
jgi:putative tricarboxylic transport membrane protein